MIGFSLGIGVGGGGRLRFLPTAIFTASEPGTWYDPSDLTTLFQDSAGVTPVTAPGQTVGLMLDKSQGLVLGSELVTNGTFDSGTAGWVAGADTTLSVSAGQLVVTDPGVDATSARAYQAVPTVIGQSYRVSFDMNAIVGRGQLAINPLNANIGGALYASGALGTGALISRAVTFVATSVSTFIILDTATPSAGTVNWDNISVKLLAGNHATQATLAQRPTYGINPITGTRNLLTFTEQFDNAYWTKQEVTIVQNAAAAPNGTVTADRLVPTAVLSTHQINRLSLVTSQACAISFYLKASGYNTVEVRDGTLGVNGAIFDVSSGTVTNRGTGVGSMTSLPDGWYRCTLLVTTTGVRFYVPTSSPSFTGDGTSGILIWGAQLELGSTATNYQKVVSQYEVTEAGIASASYISFDGVDDGMVTSTITPAIDKVQVFAGVRKLSDVALGMIAEFSATYSANAGSFNLTAPDVAGGSRAYGTQSRGSAAATITQRSTTATGAAPDTSLLCGLMDIAGDSTILRRNGTASAAGAGDQGTGDYLAYPLYIGRRGGASAPFNGRIYSLIMRFGANLTAGQIASTELYVNGKTGAY